MIRVFPSIISTGEFRLEIDLHSIRYVSDEHSITLVVVDESQIPYPVTIVSAGGKSPPPFFCGLCGKFVSDPKKDLFRCPRCTVLMCPDHLDLSPNFIRFLTAEVCNHSWMVE